MIDHKCLVCTGERFRIVYESVEGKIHLFIICLECLHQIEIITTPAHIIGLWKGVDRQ